MSKISVIIPCYNEEKTIEEILNKIFDLTHLSMQIIVVDDFSTDKSLEIINKVSKFKEIEIIKHKENLGKGSAIISAQKIVNGEIVIIQDADLEYDPKDYDKLIEPIKNKEFKVVYGSRVLNKNIFENLENFSHWFRIVGNSLLTKLSNILNKQNLTDAHTCYKAFDAEVFEKINLKEKNFNFCPEVTTKISKLGHKIKEVSISYNGRNYDSGKKIKSIDGIKAIITLFKYKFFN